MQAAGAGDEDRNGSSAASFEPDILPESLRECPAYCSSLPGWPFASSTDAHMNRLCESDTIHCILRLLTAVAVPRRQSTPPPDEEARFCTIRSHGSSGLQTLVAAVGRC